VTTQKLRVAASIPSLNTIIDFIMLEKGIFLEAFLSTLQIKLMHGGFSTKGRGFIPRAPFFLPRGSVQFMRLLQSRLVLTF
jgi:hypothetical protein